MNSSMDETDRSMSSEGHYWGLIRFDKAENITIRNCRILNAGMHGISLCGGCVNINVTGCEIAHAGMSGMRLRGQPAIYRLGDARTATDINHHNVNFRTFPNCLCR